MALRKVLSPLLPLYLQQPSRPRDLAAWDSMGRIGNQHLLDIHSPETSLPDRPQDSCTTYIPRPDEELEHRSLLEELSEEAKEVVAIILEAPGDVLQFIASPVRGKITTSRLAGHLRRSLGWPPEKISRTFRELEQYANDLGAL